MQRAYAAHQSAPPVRRIKLEARNPFMKVTPSSTNVCTRSNQIHLDHLAFDALVIVAYQAFSAIR